VSSRENANEAIQSSIATLTAAGVPLEELAEYVPRRPRLLGSSRAHFRSLGKVWHLGVLLVSPDGSVYSTGASTRAVRPRHPNNQSVSAEARRHFRDTAFKGPFVEGATINYDVRPVDFSPEGLRSPFGSVFEHDGRILVRWRPGADETNSIPLADYIAEKVTLAVASTQPSVENP
jgi:hypothetical protein